MSNRQTGLLQKSGPDLLLCRSQIDPYHMERKGIRSAALFYGDSGRTSRLHREQEFLAKGFETTWAMILPTRQRQNLVRTPAGAFGWRLRSRVLGQVRVPLR